MYVGASVYDTPQFDVGATPQSNEDHMVCGRPVQEVRVAVKFVDLRSWLNETSGTEFLKFLIA
jgi:hypothetical protein